MPLPILVDADFDIDFKFDDYKNVLCNMRDLNYNLTFANINEEVIHVHGLIGVDVIHFMKNVKIINCMNGPAWMFFGGIARFGNS